MHYLDEGEGFPILLLHGNPTWSFLYRKVIKHLDGSCRLIAPDYPGFGMSTHPPNYGYTPQEHAEWVNALIDHLDLDRFVLMVQDWGGPIGLSIAVNRPDDVAGLVIGNTWAWKADDRLMRVFSAIIGGPLGKFLILRFNFFARRLMPPLLTQTDVKTSEVLKAYTDPFPTRNSRMGTYVFPWAINNSDAWLASLEENLHLLANKPVELVIGLKDFIFSKDAVIERWQLHFPNAELDRISDVGHFLQEESPDRVAAAILRVLEQYET